MADKVPDDERDEVIKRLLTESANKVSLSHILLIISISVDLL